MKFSGCEQLPASSITAPARGVSLSGSSKVSVCHFQPPTVTFSLLRKAPGEVTTALKAPRVSPRAPGSGSGYMVVQVW